MSDVLLEGLEEEPVTHVLRWRQVTAMINAMSPHLWEVRVQVIDTFERSEIGKVLPIHGSNHKTYEEARGNAVNVMYRMQRTLEELQRIVRLFYPELKNLGYRNQLFDFLYEMKSLDTKADSIPEPFPELQWHCAPGCKNIGQPRGPHDPMCVPAQKDWDKQ